jgi:hypothetical protein
MIGIALENAFQAWEIRFPESTRPRSGNGRLVSRGGTFTSPPPRSAGFQPGIETVPPRP